MAHDSQEVEIKTPITRKKYLRLMRFLRNNSMFVKYSKQIDIYFSPRGKLFLKPKYPFEWLSLRERDGKITINYKHWYPEGAEATTHCDEYETSVGDKKQLRKLLAALGYEELAIVEKLRHLFVKNDLEVSLDKVKDLGYYIEIESLSNKGGVEKTRKKILEYAKILGIKKVGNVAGGYAAELMRKKGYLHS